VTLVEVTSPARRERFRHEISSLGLEDATALGNRLFDGGARRPLTALADESVNLLYEALEHQGRPAITLARAYLTRPLHELSDELQALVAENVAPSERTSHDTRCLTLVASRGQEHDWNDPRGSAGRRALAVPSQMASTRCPLVARLAVELETDVPQGSAPSEERITETRPLRGFYVSDARSSSDVSQRFVRSYDIASVFGFGVRLSTGNVFALVLFFRAPLAAPAARLLDLFGNYARAALEVAREATGDPTGPVALERLFRGLVLDNERAVIRWSAAADQEGARIRAENTATAKARTRERDAQHARLQRTQRAMLNVVEDLREARAELERRVEARTRELFVANAALELRNAELEDFVYIASHDLQEPLRTVSGYLQIIDRRYRGRLDDDADEFITFAIDGAQRMQALIESLLLYSRVTTKPHVLGSVELAESIRQAVANLALRVEETAAVVSVGSLPRVHADAVQMVQLFQNLISNGIKFAGTSSPRLEISSVVDGEFLRVDVVDHGVGFNPKYADRIFKMFRRLQRNTPGTGIGLAICKKITERHGGHIDADSSPGQGSVFRVFLPRTLEVARE
jgi:signal transduction histidine kinase